MTLTRSISGDPPQERRRAARAPVFVNAHGYHVELLDHRRIAIHRDEWLNLACRSIEPNIFFDPDFLLPAARFLSGDLPTFVVIRRVVDGRMKLVGLCPISERDMRSGRRMVRIWRHPYTALGVPLFDRRWFKGAFDAMLDWLAHAGRSALIFADLRIDHPFARMLLHRARRIGSRISTFDVHERPVLHTGGAAIRSTNTQRAIARNFSKLKKLGKIEFRAARSVEELIGAFLTFLSLEEQGWKGRRGTALAEEEGTARFALTAVHALAKRRSCYVWELRHCDQTIVTVVAFGQPDNLVCWKTAFDEKFARFSPGLLLMASVTDAWLTDPAFAFADSCAAGGANTTVARLWNDRVRIGDVLVAVSPRRYDFRIADAHERVRRSMRRAAKVAYHAFVHPGRK